MNRGFSQPFPLCLRDTLDVIPRRYQKMKALRFSLAVVVGLVAVLAGLTLLGGGADVAWAQGGSADLWTVRDDVGTTTVNTPVSLNVLANDSVVSGNVLRGHSVGTPVNGTATIIPDGTVTYTPTASFLGSNTFTYTVRVCPAGSAIPPYTGCTVITEKHGNVVIEVTAPGYVGGTASVLPPPTGGTTVITFAQSPDPQAPVPPVLEFPHGAITRSAVLVYREPITPTPPTTGVPGGFMFGGRRLSLELSVDGVLQPGFQFLVPVTVTMQYNDSDVAGLDERTLEFLYWNGTEWSSDGITVIERDTINNRITVSVTHLTEFALFARPIHVYLPIVQRNSAS